MSSPPPAPPPRQSQSFLSRYRFPMACVGLGVIALLFGGLWIAQFSSNNQSQQLVVNMQTLIDDYAARAETDSQSISAFQEDLEKERQKTTDLETNLAERQREADHSKQQIVEATNASADLEAEIEDLNARLDRLSQDAEVRAKKQALLAQAGIRVAETRKMLLEGYQAEVPELMLKIKNSEPRYRLVTEDESKAIRPWFPKPKSWWLQKAEWESFLAVDLTGTPMEFQAIHKQITLLQRTILKEGLVERRDPNVTKFNGEFLGWVFETPSDLMKTRNDSMKQYDDLVLKYRLILNERSDE